jgi:hypothetical protein
MLLLHFLQSNVQVELMALPPWVPEEVGVCCNGHVARLILRTQASEKQQQACSAWRLCIIKLWTAAA